MTFLHKIELTTGPRTNESVWITQWPGKLTLAFLFHYTLLPDEHKEEFCNADNLRN